MCLVLISGFVYGQYSKSNIEEAGYELIRKGYLAAERPVAEVNCTVKIMKFQDASSGFNQWNNNDALPQLFNYLKTKTSNANFICANQKFVIFFIISCILISLLYCWCIILILKIGILYLYNRIKSTLPINHHNYHKYLTLKEHTTAFFLKLKMRLCKK